MREHEVFGRSVMPAAGFLAAIAAAASDGLSASERRDHRLPASPRRSDSRAGEDIKAMQTVIQMQADRSGQVTVHGRGEANGEWTTACPLRRSRPRRVSTGRWTSPPCDLVCATRWIRRASTTPRQKRASILGPACRSIRHLWYRRPLRFWRKSRPTPRPATSMRACWTGACRWSASRPCRPACETAPTRVLTSIGRISIVGALQERGGRPRHRVSGIVRWCLHGGASSSDMEGRLVAEAMDVMVQPVAAAATAPRDWFYTVEWLQKPLVTRANRAPVTSPAIRGGAAAPAGHDGPRSRQWPRPISFASSVAGRRCGRVHPRCVAQARRPAAAGKTIAAADMRTELGIAECHARAFARMLDILGEQGDLAVEGPGRWMVSARPRRWIPSPSVSRSNASSRCLLPNRLDPLGRGTSRRILRGTLDVLQH